jgi:hypothetical protein
MPAPMGYGRDPKHMVQKQPMQRCRGISKAQGLTGASVVPTAN